MQEHLSRRPLRLFHAPDLLELDYCHVRDIVNRDRRRKLRHGAAGRVDVSTMQEGALGLTEERLQAKVARHPEAGTEQETGFLLPRSLRERGYVSGALAS